MKKRLMMLAMLAGVVSANAKSMEDHELWLTGGVSTKLTEDVSISVSEDMYFRDGGEELYYYHTQIAVPFKLNEHWTIAPGYRYIRKKGSDWTIHNRAQVDVSYKNVYGKMAAKARVRLQYTDQLNSDNSSWVTRPYVEVSPAKSWTEHNIKPYTAVEVFYNIDDDDLSTLRNYFGLKGNVTEKVAGSAYLLRVDKEKDHDWQDTYVLGFSLGYKF